MAKRFSKIAILLMLVLALLVPMMVMSVGAAETSATITFAEDKAQRTSFSTTQQVWENDGITLTNTGSVADYTNPVRLYKNSKVVIGAPGNITKIVFATTSSDYATALQNSITEGSATVDGYVVTVKPSESKTSYSISSLSAQVRLISLEVYYASLEERTVSFSVPEGSVAPITGTNISLPEGPALSGSYSAYTFAGWATTEIADTDSEPEGLLAAGSTYIPTEDITLHAVYTYSVTTDIGSSYVETDISEIGANDVVVITMLKPDGKFYALPHDKGSSGSPVPSVVSVSNEIITSTVDDSIKWNIGKDENELIIYPNGETSKWLYCTSSNTGVRVGDNENKIFTIEDSHLKHSATGRFLGVYNAQDWRCYTSINSNITGQTLAFFVLKTGKIEIPHYITLAPQDPGEGECTHENTTTVTVAATCEANGSTKVICECGHVVSSTTINALGHVWGEGEQTKAPTCQEKGERTFTCTRDNSHTKTEEIAKLSHDWDDGEVVTEPTCTTAGEKQLTCSVGGETKTEAIPALGHNYVNGICAKCFDKEIVVNASGSATIDFSTTDQRDTQTTSQQIWSSDELTFTNNKAGSTSNIIDSSAPVRLYKNSEVVINLAGMTKIVFNCNTAGYATDLEGSITNGTVTVDDKVVTVVLDAPVDSYTITLSVGQIRLDSITVYYGSEKQDDAIVGASLYIGKDLSMLYNVTTAGDIADYTMKFTFNGEEIVVNATQFGDNYFFVLDAIAPNLMGENIKAELYCGDECVAVKEAYSVLEYCEYFLKGEGSANCSAELKELLANLLEYGAAAQQYKSETELGAEDLVNNGVTGAVEYECTENVKEVTGDAAIIAGAGVSFGVDNKIYFRLVENYEEIFGAVTVKINGEDAEIVGGYIYTEGVKATELSTVFTLEISVGETVIKTAKYSITSYVTIIGAGTSEGAALARALYNYGCSAKNYMGV